MTGNVFPDLPSPTISPDIQEALSRQYSDRTIILLPLSSGKIAIFDRGFNLKTLVDEVPTKIELQRLSILYFANLKQPTTSTTKQAVAHTNTLPSKLNIEI